MLTKFFFRVCPGLNQQSGKIRARRIVHRCQRTLIQEFHCADAHLLKGYDRPCRLPNVREIYHGAGPETGQRKRLHRDLAKEGQSAFGADQQVSDDVERIVEPHERQNVETGDVLD